MRERSKVEKVLSQSLKLGYWTLQLIINLLQVQKFSVAILWLGYFDVGSLNTKIHPFYEGKPKRYLTPQLVT